MASPVHTELLPVSDIHSAEANPLADNRVSLSWKPVADAVAYRVYSDMGTGYGIHLFKAETESHELTDTGLRSGLSYHYRVACVTSAGERPVAWAKAITPYRPKSQASGHTDASVGKRTPAAEADDVPAPATPQPGEASIRVTPAPTPLPPDTVILGLLSATDYADDVEDTLTIVGEVRNDTRLDVGQTTVTATFYDTNGQIIEEANGATMLGTLAPGIRSPFNITLPRPAGLADYSLRATGRPITLPPTDAGLNIVNTRRFEDSTGFYHIAGVIENQSGRRVEQVRVIVTLYDRAGRVVNVGFAYPQPASLSPNDRADFDVTFTYYPKVFSHLAVAIGD
jgi:hypothetical protein